MDGWVGGSDVWVAGSVDGQMDRWMAERQMLGLMGEWMTLMIMINKVPECKSPFQNPSFLLLLMPSS